MSSPTFCENQRLERGLQVLRLRLRKSPGIQPLQDAQEPAPVPAAGIEKRSELGPARIIGLILNERGVVDLAPVPDPLLELRQVSFFLFELFRVAQARAVKRFEL